MIRAFRYGFAAGLLIAAGWYTAEWINTALARTLTATRREWT